MGPLEALLNEEQEALASPSTLLDPEMAAADGMLPYRKHWPYFGAVVARGVKLYDAGVLPSDNLEKVVAEFSGVHERLSEQNLREAVKKVETKYGVAIPKETVEAYSVQLAGRVLDFAREHLVGLPIETSSYEDQARSITDIGQLFTARAFDEQRQILWELGHIRRFYEANTQKQR